ncbi:MAG: hypothetical protein EHM85_02880 [Desulfobacteraceae bacterium]|nr:MAG: hypothetical protein EHM85_02880 [Desulfobacteraceae bacterium]
MNIKRLFIIFLFCFIMLFISACTPTIYDIPVDQWNKLTEAQQQATIDGYNKRMRLREIERQKEAQRRAREEEIRALEAHRQEQLCQERVAAIYMGEAGQIGDLLRVTLQGGQMLIGNRHRQYQPISFKIANGETKKIEIINVEGRNYDNGEEMQVLYQDGTLIFDDDPYTRKPFRIIYDHGWKSGKTYSPVSTESKLRLRNVQIFIEIIPHLRKTRP